MPGTVPYSTSHRGQRESYDVIIVGAGFGGLYALHRLRGAGLSVRVYEQGGGVGGTWYWNRYPGARCDVESMQYSYSFSEELQQDWVWSERYSPQPEILRYANHVADRFRLRPDIEFNTAVESAVFDETASRWTVTMGNGRAATARFVVLATGCLSSVRMPVLEGQKSFDGAIYHTARWPDGPVEFRGKRVAIIGTGSSAVQSIPLIAEQAGHLTVFQRTSNFSIPAQNKPLTDDDLSAWKSRYPELRRRARAMKNGIYTEEPAEKGALEDAEPIRRARYQKRWEHGGTTFMTSYNDLLLTKAANDTAADFVRAKIAEIVKDPAVAGLLQPDSHPIGSKRLCADTDYYVTFNRPNVTLIDIRNDPIQCLTPDGIRLASGDHEVDVIIFATGFDAMTGSIAKIDIRGRGGRTLKQKWVAGPRTYLGLMSAGFPNLFTITGPGSPSVLTNMIQAIEQHVDWIADCIRYMEAHGLGLIDPRERAEDEWVAHVNEVASNTLYPQANSWYMGANIPGKPRVFLPYIGGVVAYRKKCDNVAANNYEGFALTTLRAKAQC
jgi:cyclohexanone monooxygenase